MDTRRKIIAFLPLRKGSKSIPRKNVKLLNGKPLFQWVLDTILTSGLFNQVWIATDDEIVKKIALREYQDKLSIFHRSPESAKDCAPTIDVLSEFLSAHCFDQDDRLVLFQATSPFTSHMDIQLMMGKILDDRYDSVVSCYRLKKYRWDDHGSCLDYSLYKRPRRQDYDGFLVESGAIYASKISFIMKNHAVISGNISVVEIGSTGQFDIDEPTDWILAEAYIKNVGKLNENE